MTDFHFLRPYWLLAICALIFALWLVKKLSLSQSGWAKFIPAHLSASLLDSNNKGRSYSIILPAVIGILTIVALAGPTWKKLPQPVYQVERGSVLIMDMSYSMYSTDLSPNRLTRARYKAIDLLDNLNEGDIGLVAYAGDAFVISPLTEDINNIKLLLPSLTPEIMPELGSNPLAALTLAHDMLINAGHIEGDIYWLTDGIDNEDVPDINAWSQKHPHSLNILGIGSKEGAPITLPSGELLKDNNGAIVIPHLTEGLLYGVSKQGRGTYQTITNNMNDVKNLLANLSDKQQSEKESNSLNSGDQWQEVGPYLVIAILVLMLGYFRRGAILSLSPLLIIGLFTQSTPASASLWNDLWKTQNQQAQEKFNQGNFSDAAKQFENPLWKGSALYRDGNYQEALEAFQQHDTVDALYNQGNALAKLGQLEEAIAAYDKALAKDPKNEDALQNKALIEQLKNQQNQQNQQDSSEQNDQNQDEQSKDEQSQDDQQKGDQNGEQKNDQSSEQQQDQQSEQSENKNNDQNQQGQQEQNDAQENEQESKENAEKTDEQQPEKQEKQATEQDESAAEKTDNEEELSVEAKLAQEKLEQEMDQKHQQLLNMVTDDPYLLLRNKMQLEYQKRRQNTQSAGDKKKW